MLNEIPDLPPGVIGFELSGKLEGEDYRDVLLPAVEQAATSGGVRLVLVIPAFEGMSGGAVWQDMKMGAEQWRAWKRIAFVTDVEWMIHATAAFGWMTPGEVKHFPLGHRAEAIAWVAG